MADMPKAAAVVWMLTPLHIPSAVTMAALRPQVIPWVMTKMLSGPGEIVSANEAPINPSMEYMVMKAPIRTVRLVTKKPRFGGVFLNRSDQDYITSSWKLLHP